MKTLDQINFKRLIIVSYRLPFKLVRKKDEYYAVQNSGGLVSAILSLSEKMHSLERTMPEILWVGMGEKKLSDENIHSSFRLFPVEIPRKINDKYYGGFCNNTIWPLFHYFTSSTRYDTSYFEAYKTANNLFFDKLRELIEPGDLIWIHDYQLFFLPDLVRQSFPKALIGFFLHIPFPSFEILRLLPVEWREMILKGMTGADLIGFHTNDYAQYFIRSVKRILGYKVDRNYINVNNRITKADAFPIGIDFDKFHDACFVGKTEQKKKKIMDFLSGKKLVFSLDRLDYSKGFIHRLKAYERFLEKYPEWHFKVVFNMIVIPSRDIIQEYRLLRKEIEAISGRINGKYGTLDWMPLVYQYKSIPFHEMVAIYNLSDVGLITPLRDGMNLVAKEYIASQNGHYGMLIISEMTGAAVELNEAITINPTDTEKTADAINQALIMPEEEKIRRILKMQNRLKRYDIFTWTNDFFNQLEDIKKENDSLQVNYLDESTLNHIRGKYCHAKKRLFLIDYDGTLTPLVKTPEMAIMNDETRTILENLIADTRNTVIIISGRTREFMDELFKDLGAVLVAEHGFFTRYPGNHWVNNAEINLSWKDRIRPLLDDYIDRCNGSVIEEKYSSMAWHYRNADEDIASMRINELKDDLREILVNETKLQVLEGNKVLEIKSILYDKGSIASHIINNDNYDFIIALGDDNTDEDLFKVIPESGFTIRVGSKPTNARFNIKNQSQIVNILSFFSDCSR